MSPRNATTEKRLLTLKSDNKDFRATSIIVSENHVSIWPTSDGGGYFSIPKQDFNKMVDWYNAEQK